MAKFPSIQSVPPIQSPEVCSTTVNPKIGGLTSASQRLKVENGGDSTTVNIVDSIHGACICAPLGKVIKVPLPFASGVTEDWATYSCFGSGRQFTSATEGAMAKTSHSGNSVIPAEPVRTRKTTVTVTGAPTAGRATCCAYNGANQLTNIDITPWPARCRARRAAKVGASSTRGASAGGFAPRTSVWLGDRKLPTGGSPT